MDLGLEVANLRLSVQFWDEISAFENFFNNLYDIVGADEVRISSVGRSKMG